MYTCIINAKTQWMKLCACRLVWCSVGGFLKTFSTSRACIGWVSRSTTQYAHRGEPYFSRYCARKHINRPPDVRVYRALGETRTILSSNAIEMLDNLILVLRYIMSLCIMWLCKLHICNYISLPACGGCCMAITSIFHLYLYIHTIPRYYTTICIIVLGIYIYNKHIYMKVCTRSP